MYVPFVNNWKGHSKTTSTDEQHKNLKNLSRFSVLFTFESCRIICLNLSGSVYFGNVLERLRKKNFEYKFLWNQGILVMCFKNTLARFWPPQSGRFLYSFNLKSLGFCTEVSKPKKQKLTVYELLHLPTVPTL